MGSPNLGMSPRILAASAGEDADQTTRAHLAAVDLVRPFDTCWVTNTYLGARAVHYQIHCRDVGDRSAHQRSDPSFLSPR